MKKNVPAEQRQVKKREERLAAQLRTNLARRKSQARERKAEEIGESAEKKPR